MGQRGESGVGGEGTKMVVEYASAGQDGNASGGLARTSLICAIVAVAALVTLLAIHEAVVQVLVPLVLGAGAAAVVLGGIVWRQRRSAAGMPAMAKAGVGLGLWAVVALVLAGGLPFGMQNTREGANRVQCASNLRTIWVGLKLYADQNHGVLPLRFDQAIASGDVYPHMLVCPSGNDVKASGATTQAVVADLGKPGRCSYVYCAAGLRLKDLPAGFIVAHERLENHDGDGMNVVYGDGQVLWFHKAEARRVMRELEWGHNPPWAKR